MKIEQKKRASTDYVITVVLILSITAIIYMSLIITNTQNKVSYASAQSVDVNSAETIKANETKIENRNINLNEIIKENNKDIIKEEIIKEEKDLEYITKYTNNPDLPKGMIQVVQVGIDGKQEVYTKKIYMGEELVSEESFGSKIIQSSINKLVEIGTGLYASNYEAKVGDTLYVTSSLLAVRTEPDDQAYKIISLNKNTEVKLVEIYDEWYKIAYQSYIGWAKAESLTYLNPNANNIELGVSTGKSRSELLGKLSFNMDLTKPSGLSLEQFKKIFENETKDVNNIFYDNAEYFYYTEKQYGINGVFLAAVAIHESGWGASTIASNKNNLFGYGAYDSNPYGGAYEFTDYSEGIDLLGRVFVKYYLNPAGTKIYDGNIAAGTYYNGQLYLE